MGIWSIRVRAALTVALAVALAWFLAAAAPAAAAGYLENQTFTLQNGLTVILHQDDSSPFVAVHVRYAVGSRNDPPGQGGMARLLTHLAFKPSEYWSRPASILGEAGAAEWEGEIDSDDTVYSELVSSLNLERVLWMESNRMGFPNFAQLDPEAYHQLAERAQQTRDVAPYARAERQLWHSLFPAPHPYHNRSLDVASEMGAIKRDDIKAFFRRWYAPSNAILTLAGHFNQVEVRGWINKYFASLKSPADPSLPSPPALPLLRLEKELSIEHPQADATLPTVFLAWLTPPAFSPESAAGDLLTLLLHRGRTGRLHERLIPEQALSLGVTQRKLRLQSVFRIRVETTTREKLSAVVQSIDTTLREIAEQGISDAELLAARAWMRNRTFSHLDRLLNKAAELSRYQAYKGRANWLAKDLLRYQSVSAAQIQELIRNYLGPQQRVVLYAGPNKTAMAETPGGRP